MLLDKTGLQYGLYAKKKEIEINKNRNSPYLEGRFHPKAIENLDDEELAKLFKGEEIEMAIMSIDIRKSQEIMLRANTLGKWAKFISGLTDELKKIVIENYGVYDKFTDDGILAYFPVFIQVLMKFSIVA
ncbi:MAG: hypothetical protein FWC26_00770 [Fibromonadales bacterium]|nr:hypothetical protein [Fibromonadales bacterium]